MILQTMVSGIPLVSGPRIKIANPSVYVVCGAPGTGGVTANPWHAHLGAGNLSS